MPLGSSDVLMCPALCLHNCINSLNFVVSARVSSICEFVCISALVLYGF